mgnify:CR=1 FL=1
MKKTFITLFFLSLMSYASACTNFIATKGATKDGSVLVTYNADDYGLFTNLCHYPAGTHAFFDFLIIAILTGVRLLIMIRMRVMALSLKHQ